MSTYLRTWRVNGAIIRQRGRSFQLEEYLNVKRKRRAATKNELRHKIGRLAKAYPATLVSEITASESARRLPSGGARAMST
jgi:hypothetical protein